MNEEFRTHLAEALQMPGAQLTESTPLAENWDSLAIMTTISLLDRHYSVVVSPTELENCTTVGELLQLAERDRSKSSD